MSNMFDERRHPSRREEGNEPHRYIENYWDLSGNQGQIYIIPSGDVAEVLENTNSTVTPMDKNRDN